ncbi:MAG: M48 family metallopeptidase [Bacteroidota bacterium]
MIHGQPIPLVIYRELRSSVRASFGKDHIIFRTPVHLTPTQFQKQFTWLQNWLEQKMTENPHLFQPYQSSRTYQSGDTIRIRGQQFLISIEEVDKKSHSGTIDGQAVKLRLGKMEHPQAFNQVVRKLLSRLFGQYFLPEIKERVHALNKLFFQQDIQQVKLKYTHTRWGSCSSKGNINLSTRLLLAPKEVVDYVIVHELSHLVEFNHSPRFWNLVEQIMPNYREHERWLKQYGSACDF